MLEGPLGINFEGRILIFILVIFVSERLQYQQLGAR